MTAEQAGAIVAAITGSLESESVATRKVMAAVPQDNRDYKPDPKSRSAWDLVVHMATSDIWFADCILNGTFEWTGEPPMPKEFTDPTAVAKWHETTFAQKLAQIRALTPDQLLREADFFGTKGPVVTFLVPFNNHHIHHRGQLAAYLRPAGSKVPAIYGMSADENLFAQA